MRRLVESWRTLALLSACIAALVIFCAAGSATAAQSRVAGVTPASGAWAGKLSKYHTSKLTFSVSSNHKTIQKLSTSVVPIVCGGGFAGPVTKLVSMGVTSATIKSNGSFAGKLVVHTSGSTSTSTLVGRFSSATSASGTLSYKAGGCNVSEPFSAKKK